MRIAFLALTALAANGAGAAEISSTVTKENKVVISLKGEIVAGDTDRLTKLITTANSANRLVSGIRLSSPGGSLLEGVKLAEAIRFAKIATVVPSGSMCASACFIAFAAGSEKYVSYSAQVGVHGASDRAGKTAGDATIAMAKIVKELGVGVSVIGKMVVTPPDQMVWLDPNELRSLGTTMTGKPAQAASNPLQQTQSQNQVIVPPKPPEQAASPPPIVSSRDLEIQRMNWTEVAHTMLPASNSTLSEMPGFKIVLGQDAKRLRQIVDGRADNSVEADSYKFDSESEVLFQWIPAGYVHDNDWGQIDADELLAQIRQGDEKANAERSAKGARTLTTIGWRQKPNFNHDTKTVSWAIDGISDTGERLVNAVALKLGRYGFERMVWIATPDAMNGSNDLAVAERAHQFNVGHRYVDYVPSTDRSAEYGIAGLVAGAMGVKVLKAAGAGALIVALKKFGVVLLLPFLWIGRKLLCSFSWNRDPAAGLIFIQSGPRRRGSTLASDFVGGRDWNADCGDDRQDTTGVFFAWQADQGDLPRAAGIAQGRAEGHPVERDGVSV